MANTQIQISPPKKMKKKTLNPSCGRTQRHLFAALWLSPISDDWQESARQSEPPQPGKQAYEQRSETHSGKSAKNVKEDRLSPRIVKVQNEKQLWMVDFMGTYRRAKSARKSTHLEREREKKKGEKKWEVRQQQSKVSQ